MCSNDMSLSDMSLNAGSFSAFWDPGIFQCLRSAELTIYLVKFLIAPPSKISAGSVVALPDASNPMSPHTACPAFLASSSPYLYSASYVCTRLKFLLLKSNWDANLATCLVKRAAVMRFEGWPSGDSMLCDKLQDLCLLVSLLSRWQ